MNKNLLRVIGIQIIILGFVLSIFEFLIDNSEFVIGFGVVILITSLFLKKISALKTVKSLFGHF